MRNLQDLARSSPPSGHINSSILEVMGKEKGGSLDPPGEIKLFFLLEFGVYDILFRPPGASPSGSALGFLFG